MILILNLLLVCLSIEKYKVGIVFEVKRQALRLRDHPLEPFRGG
jgi:hypothetical protein